MDIKEYLSQIGKKGGDATKKRGSEYYRELQKKSVARRLAKKQSTNK